MYNIIRSTLADQVLSCQLLDFLQILALLFTLAIPESIVALHKTDQSPALP